VFFAGIAMSELHRDERKEAGWPGQIRAAFRQIRMSIEVRVRPPVPIPTRVKEHGASADLARGQGNGVDRRSGRRIDAHDVALQVGDRFERQLGEVLAVLVAMEGTVDVGAGVGDHLDLADLKLGSMRVLRARCLATQPVTDDRCGKALVRDHAVFDDVAHVDQTSAGCAALPWLHVVSSRTSGYRPPAGTAHGGGSETWMRSVIGRSSTAPRW
jgi:hypothetical protein